jgi:hypothetical protein
MILKFADFRPCLLKFFPNSSPSFDIIDISFIVSSLKLFSSVLVLINLNCFLFIGMDNFSSDLSFSSELELEPFDDNFTLLLLDPG